MLATSKKKLFSKALPTINHLRFTVKHTVSDVDATVLQFKIRRRMESAVTGLQEMGTTSFFLTLISSKKVEHLHMTKALYNLVLRALHPLHPSLPLHHPDRRVACVQPEYSLTTPSQGEHRDASYVPLERTRIFKEAVKSVENVKP